MTVDDYRDSKPWRPGQMVFCRQMADHRPICEYRLGLGKPAFPHPKALRDAEFVAVFKTDELIREMMKANERRS